ncbi:MAG: hypothetical protein ACTS46_01205 [Candidatus Hodgkinia cicadicola]
MYLIVKCKFINSSGFGFKKVEERRLNGDVKASAAFGGNSIVTLKA